MEVTTAPAGKYVELRLVTAPEFDNTACAGNTDEAYNINVQSGSSPYVTLTAVTKAGIFYGIQVRFLVNEGVTSLPLLSIDGYLW